MFSLGRFWSADGEVHPDCFAPPGKYRVVLWDNWKNEDPDFCTEEAATPSVIRDFDHPWAALALAWKHTLSERLRGLDMMDATVYEVYDDQGRYRGGNAFEQEGVGYDDDDEDDFEADLADLCPSADTQALAKTDDRLDIISWEGDGRADGDRGGAAPRAKGVTKLTLKEFLGEDRFDYTREGEDEDEEDDDDECAVVFDDDPPNMYPHADEQSDEPDEDDFEAAGWRTFRG